MMFFEALKRTCPVPIEFASINSGAKGYFSHTENKIVINKGMQQTQVIKTALHEIAHQRLHSKASLIRTRAKHAAVRKWKPKVWHIQYAGTMG